MATYGVERGRVFVKGPWEAIKPSSDADEVIDQLCPAVVRLPRAREEDYGLEYCGVIYSVGDGLYYASHPSPLHDSRAGRVSPQKNCYVPSIVRDDRGHTVRLGDYHSHPWEGSRMSSGPPGDRRSATQFYSFRIQFDTACTLQKYVPYMNEDRPGELFVRRGKIWKLIGIIKPENKSTGIVTHVDG